MENRNPLEYDSIIQERDLIVEDAKNEEDFWGDSLEVGNEDLDWTGNIDAIIQDLEEEKQKTSGSDSWTSKLQLYIDIINSTPRLDDEKERNLFLEKDDGGIEAIGELTYANLGLVFKIAGKYRNLGMEFEDLIQEGCSALLYAIEQYNPNHESGARFSTYAWPVIRGRILDCITENTGGGRFSKYEIRMVLRLRKEESEFIMENGRKPSTEELAERLGVMERTAKRYSDISNELYMDSLDRKIDSENDNRTVGDRIGDNRHIGQDDLVIDQEESEVLTVEHVILAMYDLTPREKEVVFQTSGILGEQPKTYQDIGERLGVNEDRVRDIRQRALDKIQRKMRELGFRIKY